MILPAEIRQKAKAYADNNGGGLPMIRAYCEGAMAMLEHNAETVSEIKVEGNDDMRCPTFEEFWQAYNYKKAKAQTERFWKKLSTRQKIEIMLSLPSYLQSLNGEKCYQMYPATYINPTNQRWKDEVTRRKPQPRQLSADEREREFLMQSALEASAFVGADKS